MNRSQAGILATVGLISAIPLGEYLAPPRIATPQKTERLVESAFESGGMRMSIQKIEQHQGMQWLTYRLEWRGERADWKFNFMRCFADLMYWDEEGNQMEEWLVTIPLHPAFCLKLRAWDKHTMELKPPHKARYVAIGFNRADRWTDKVALLPH